MSKCFILQNNLEGGYKENKYIFPKSDHEERNGYVSNEMHLLLFWFGFAITDNRIQLFK